MKVTLREIEACEDEQQQFEMLTRWNHERPELGVMTGSVLENTFHYMRYIEQLEKRVSMSHWTTQKPNREGLQESRWWWRLAKGSYHHIVTVTPSSNDLFVFFANQDCNYATCLGGEWSSEPIPEPEEHHE